MSTLLPKATIETLKQFNDLGVKLYGIDCTLYIPNNLTTLEPTDMYISPDTILYTEHPHQKIWLEWYDKALVKLRRANAYAEDSPPITARFLSYINVLVNSYIVLPTEYEGNQYKTLEFEIVDVVLEHTYDAEVYRKFKLAPRRKKDM